MRSNRSAAMKTASSHGFPRLADLARLVAGALLFSDLAPTLIEERSRLSWHAVERGVTRV
jgi:hypothetical protein